MRKTKILMCAESSNIKSGFGLYTREILSRLSKIDKFEVAELSCYATIQHPKKEWKVYPNCPLNSDTERMKKYNASNTNAFGLWRFDQVAVDFKPDIVFDMRDYWMLSYQEIAPTRPYYNWVIAPTVDSLPQPDSWLQTMSNADLVLAHTDWAIEYLKNSGRNIKTGKAVPDSVDTDVFSPISHSINYQKSKMMVPTDSFVIGAVMRNQKRKLIPNLFSVLKKVIQYTNNPNIYLYLHTSYPEPGGWDLPAYLQEYSVFNNVLFTYYCSSCKKPHASRWQEGVKVCPHCKQKTAKFPSVLNGLTDPQMADVYNCFDFYAQYAVCEGLGIPQLEAASCGIPLASVDYSAMQEVTTKLDAHKISFALKRDMETGAERAVPNDSHLVQILYNQMKISEETMSNQKEKMRNNILEHYSWDKTADTLVQQFETLEPKDRWNEPLTTNHKLKVPEMPNNRDFVEFLVKHVIQSPYLLKTHFIQSMIYRLDAGWQKINNSIQPYNRKNAVNQLEQALNHKMLTSQLLSGKIDQSQEDYIKYANE